MKASSSLISVQRIAQAILVIRRQRVMLDADLAAIYQVETKALNRAVKRNRERFPADFMFQLTLQESESMRCQIGTASAVTQSRRNVRFRPYAFTEHGAVMLACVLNSPVAVQASIQVVRAFVVFRGLLVTHKELAAKFAELEHRIDAHDEGIAALFEAIRQLVTTPGPKRRQIGFNVREGRARYLAKRSASA